MHQRVLCRRVTFLTISYKNQCDCCIDTTGADGRWPGWKLENQLEAHVIILERDNGSLNWNGISLSNEINLVLCMFER